MYVQHVQHIMYIRQRRGNENGKRKWEQAQAKECLIVVVSISLVGPHEIIPASTHSSLFCEATTPVRIHTAICFVVLGQQFHTIES